MPFPWRLTPPITGRIRVLHRLSGSRADHDREAMSAALMCIFLNTCHPWVNVTIKR